MRSSGRDEERAPAGRGGASGAAHVPIHVGRTALTSVGNQAIARAIEGVSQPSDPHEQEARRAAARAVPVAAAAASPPPTGLDPAARTAMIGLFGDPFDDVVLHTNTGAGRLAGAVGAEAVTAGRDVFFGPGGYRPDTAVGARLLAHELAHTRQSPVAGAEAHRDGPATTLNFRVEFAEPEVFLFAGTGTREQIAATLYGDPGQVFALQFVQTTQSTMVDGVVAQGIRAKSPAQLLPEAMQPMRLALDTSLTRDVERTISVLSERSIGAGDEAALAELCLRWSQRSDILTAAGGSYFDAYLGALNNRKLSQPKWWTGGLSEETKTALEWLQIEAEGSAEQIRKAIELRSTAFQGATGYTVTDRRPEFQTGDIVGRFYSKELGTYPVRILETIGHDIAEEPTARLVQRRLVGSASKDGTATGVVVPDPGGGFTGYLVDFALLDAFVPHPFQDETGHYYWYYPGTRMVAAHHLWDEATRRQFKGDVQAQSTDWEADLIGFEGAAVQVRASAASGVLTPAFVAAWQQADRAMIEVSGKLRAKQPVEGGGVAPAVRAFFDQARAQVKALDKWQTDYYDSQSDSLNASDTYLSNPYFDTETHAGVLARLTGAATAPQWRAVLTDYHRVTASMDEFLAKKLRETGGEKGKEEAARLEYAGAAARQLDGLTVDHPAGMRIRATFYALDSLTAEQGGLGEATAAPMNCLFYAYREGTTWHLVDLTTPKKEKATSESGGTGTTPPIALFTELNTKLRFPRGRLYFELPGGEIRVLTTTEETSLSEWLKGLGMTLGILAMAVGTMGASLPATVLIVGASVAGAVGAGVEMHEKAEAGVLTDADVVVGIADIISGLATAGAASSRHIIRSATLTTGSAARLATTLDSHVYRQLVGVSLFGQALSFVVTTQQILDEYYRAKAAADASGSDLALRRLLMHFFTSGSMFLMGAKSDIADMTRGPMLRLGSVGGVDVALPSRAALDGAHDEWVAEMAKLGARGQAGPRSGPPLEPGLVGRYADAYEAYKAYDATLQRPGEAEVGVFRNPQGEYVVMIGRATSVDPPSGGGPWRAVVHYHSNPGNALTVRMPAAADVEGALALARESGRPVTEFVEAPLPGGGSTVTSYTVAPDGKITIEYVRPNGERVSQSFADVAAYRTELTSRDVAVDPQSPHYREMMEDLDALYAGGGGRAAGARTSTGAGWQGQLDAVGGPAARQELVVAFDPYPGRLEALVGELGAVGVMRLNDKLGPAGLAQAAAVLDGPTVRNLAFNLAPAELTALLVAHPPDRITWAAQGQTGAAAREVLALPPAVLGRLAPPVGGLPATIVRNLIAGTGAVPVARLQVIVDTIPPADLVLMNERFGAEGFVQILRTDDRPAALRDMAAQLRASLPVELAAPTPLGSGAIALDSNLLIPLQRLRAGVPWKGAAPPGHRPLHDGDRRRVTALAGKMDIKFADPDNGPTQAEIEDLMTALGNRTPNAVLAETPIVADAPRGVGLLVDRNDPDYRIAMNEMATGPSNRQVGKDVGGADRSAIADMLFAQREAGGKPPVFYTDDERIARPLLERWGDDTTYKKIGPMATKDSPGKWPERFAKANPDGFEVVIRGRRIRVVLLR